MYCVFEIRIVLPLTKKTLREKSSRVSWVKEKWKHETESLACWESKRRGGFTDRYQVWPRRTSLSPQALRSERHDGQSVMNATIWDPNQRRSAGLRGPRSSSGDSFRARILCSLHPGESTPSRWPTFEKEHEAEGPGRTQHWMQHMEQTLFPAAPKC